MNIDNLKTTWKKRSAMKVEDDSLNEETLRGIIGQKYDLLFLKILIPEFIVASGYLFLIVFLIVFFDFFQDLWLRIFAIFAIVLLIIIPLLSFMAFFRY
jgi:hypothetical protein